mgnify:CR=1 FL=1
MNYTFQYPWMIAALALPILVRLLVPPLRITRPALRVPWFNRLARFANRRPAEGAAVAKTTRSQAVCHTLVWILLVTALARPQIIEPAIHKTVPTRDLLLLVDLSASMETEDFTNQANQRVDRLGAVQAVLADFLARREGDRVGLIVFGSAAFVQVPFTQDLELCKQLLAELSVGMAGPKTALGDAIGLAITLFERSKVKQRVIIALTDGNDTGSRVPPANAARIAADQGIVLHTVAVGDPSSAGEEKLDEATLKEMAAATGGKYFFAGDRQQLEDIYDTLDRLETRKIETISHRPRVDLFHWPLAGALIISLVYHLVIVWTGFRGFTANRRKRPEIPDPVFQTGGHTT